MDSKVLSSRRHDNYIFPLDQLDTLAACFKDIETSCTMNISESQLSKAKDCLESAKALTNEIDSCIKPSLSSVQSCNCFAELNDTNLESVIDCDITELSEITKKGKTECSEG